jgi:hypothetical protein
MVSGRRLGWQSLVLAALGLGLILLFPLRYGMPFRLDDVLLMDWANAHSLLDAFNPERGQMVNSFRPMFGVTAWLLTHIAGSEHPIVWQFVLTTLLVVALVMLARIARDIAASGWALIVTPILYLIGFTSILNVFFWFSDLTYALELAFTTLAWYYAVRGLMQAQLGSWAIGLLFAILAVISKEPAIVMVHAVVIGTALLFRRQIAAAWRERGPRDIKTAAGLYLLLLAVTLWIVLVSPTRVNRFFALSDPSLRSYMAGRLAYYNALLTSPLVRAIFYFPIVFSCTRTLWFQKLEDGSPKLLLLALLSLVASVFVLKSAFIALPVLVFLMTTRAVRYRERSVLMLLPYLATIFIAFATLLVTIQLVKTQLTEIAFMLTVLAAWGWVETARTLVPVLRRSPNVSIVATAILVGVAIDGAWPRLQHQEKLLRDAAAVRWNANDAVTWSAKHLPQQSTLLVTTYMLHGFENPGVLTATDDESKLRQQPTFDAGYVYTFLEQLGRRDIDRGFLDDASRAPEVLEAYRRVPNSFVMLQTEIDRTRLTPLLTPRDTLVARFSRQPYPSEIWWLRE